MNVWTSKDARLPRAKDIRRTSRSYSQKGCLMLMDTQRERDIDLGSKYQMRPMWQGECLISESMATQLGQVTDKGTVIYLKLSIKQNLNALIKKYNKDVATPQNLSIIDQSDTFMVSSTIELPCRVANVSDDASSKFHGDDKDDTVYMEYEHFMKQLV